MNEYLFTLDETQSAEFAKNRVQDATGAIESGQVIYFPNHAFELLMDEKPLLSELSLKRNRKNISFNYLNQSISGVSPDYPLKPIRVMMQRYAEYSKKLIDQVLPSYTHSLQWGRTSYRPAEILGRHTSKRQDDTRVHVDSFASSPVQGRRILRVFCNVNPNGAPRVWFLGEPFREVLSKFAPKIPPYRPMVARFLKWIKVTKSLRTKYDHAMLHLHDLMKLDDDYQNRLCKQRIDFLAQSTWIVFTDHTSHAALSGQFLLEQTFYLPIEAMQSPELSPLKQLIRFP